VVPFFTFPNQNLACTPLFHQCVLHALTISCFLKLFGEEHKLWSFPLCSFLQTSTLSSLLGSNFPLALRSQTRSDFFSNDVRDQVSHPYENIIITIPYSFRGKMRRQNILTPIVNRSFENVVNLKYFGKITTYQNLIHDEIRSRFNSSNASVV
jgi:hypothetical protein